MTTNKNTNKQKIAILFYGLTRTLSKTVASIKKHFFEVLKNNSIELDVFVHTYKIYGKYENDWSKEFTSDYVNEDVQSLLNPTFFIFDNQREIEKQIHFDEYYEKLGVWTGETPEMTKYLIKNLCLALYSKKRITEVFEKYKYGYDYAIISRPDLEFTTDINVKWLDELNDENIIIPECDSYSGCNDRLCIGTPNNVIYYGTLFDQLKEYSRETSIISEKYMLDMLNKKRIHIVPKNILYNTIRISIHNDNKNNDKNKKCVVRKFKNRCTHTHTHNHTYNHVSHSNLQLDLF